MARDYTILDVFTDTPLAGNPLAVVHDGKIQQHKTEWGKASLLEQLR